VTLMPLAEEPLALLAAAPARPGQMPHATRHVDPAGRDAPRRLDLHRVASAAGVAAHSVGRPGRPARRVQHRAPATARIRQSGFTLVVPRRIPGRTQGAGYLGTSLNEQLGLQIRPGRGAALCDLADELPARGPGRTTRHLSRDRRPVGRTSETRLGRLHRRTGRTTLGTRADISDTGGRYPCAVPWSARITPSRVLRLPPPHRASSRAGVMGISVASAVVISDEG